MGDGERSTASLPLYSCLGFFTNLCSLGVIAAGSLTLKVLSMSRSVLLILYGMAVYHDVVTVVEAIGYGIVLVGFFWYNFAKIAPKRARSEREGSVGEGTAVSLERRKVCRVSEKEREKESLCNSYAYVTRRLLLSLDTNQGYSLLCAFDFFCVFFSSFKD